MYRYLSLIVIWLVVSNAAAEALWPNCAEALSAGRRSLDVGVPEAAAKAFEFVLNTCGSAAFEADSDFKFYLALSRQLLGLQDDRTDDQKASLLSEAKDLYEDVIARQPQRYSAIFNLGVVEAKLGNSSSARVLLERAARGSGSAWYIAAYGRFLLGIGSIEQAQQEIAYAEANDPSSVEVQIAVFELALKTSRNAAISKAEALSGFWPNAALSVAVRQLIDRSWTDAESRRLWVVVARTLASEQYKPTVFSATSAGIAIGALADDRKNDAAAELLHLHVSPEKKHAYTWWNATPVTQSAFWNLARSLGAAAEKRSDVHIAYAYYHMILTADPKHVSGAAVLNLARLYAIAGDGSALVNLDDRYTPYFKDRAVRSVMGLKAQYDYHRELGILYAALSRLPDTQEREAPWRVLNASRAVGHISAAVDIAKKCARKCVWEAFGPEAELFDLLAESQERAGKDGDAAATYVIALGLYVNQDSNPIRASAIVKRLQRVPTLRATLSDQHRAVVTACATITDPACASLTVPSAPQVSDIDNSVVLPPPRSAQQESLWARVRRALAELLGASVTAPGTEGVVTAVGDNTVTIAGPNGQSTTYTLTSSTYVYNANGSRANQRLLANGQRVLIWSRADNTAVRINVEN
jgi:tetratricopeptide (TPR) repeat protein